MWNKIIGLLFTIMTLSGWAQPHYSSKLSKVPEKGFYRIDLPLSLRGHAQTTLSDLRIYNQQEEQMPYLLKREILITDQTNFIPYSIHKLKTDDQQTHIVVYTPNDTLSSLVLNTKNSDSWKKASLLGSNDSVNWYTVKEHILFTPNSGTSSTTSLQTIDFPLSDYPFYQLIINDSTSAPVNIIEIGHMSSDYQIQNSLSLLPGNYQLQQHQDTTIIRIKYDGCYPLYGIRFYISEPEFYRRTLILQNKSIHRTVLTSEPSRKQFIPLNQFTDSLTIFILNGDNSALKIDSVESYTDQLFLITYLNQPGEYKLTYGDPKALGPQYDLEFFEDKIPAILPHLTLQTIEKIQIEENRKPNAFIDFLYHYGIWILIALISLQILRIVRKMIKE